MNQGKTVVFHSVGVWVGLTENWIYTTVANLPLDHFENHVVCTRTENLDVFKWPNVHALSDESRFRYIWDRGVRKLGIRHYLDFSFQQMKKHGAKLLHSHFGVEGWNNIRLAKKAGVKHVVSVYGGIDVCRLPNVDPRWRARYRDLFEQIECVFCEGPFMGRHIAKLGCPEEKVKVHHLGVILDKIKFAPRQWDGSGPLRVLIAAAFRRTKGIPYALEALGRFQHEFPIEITIIGDAANEVEDSGEKQLILDAMEKHNLASKTRMLGFQPHSVLHEKAARHHVFLSPSVTTEDGGSEGGAPVVIIEMSASGIMVVSTTHADIPEVIHHGETGLLSAERDVEGIVNNLRWLVEHPDKWNDMARAGRLHIETEFDSVKQGVRLEAIYKDVMK